MSASVIRRGLELLRDDVRGEGAKSRLVNVNSSTRRVLDGPGLKSRGKVKGGKGPGGTRQIRRDASRNVATVKNMRVKSAVDAYRQKQKKSQLTSNLQYLLSTNYTVEPKTTSKILHQNSGRKSQNQTERPAAKPKQEKSLFTEEEFQRFQKEYFGQPVDA
ncbi:active regulator of SIRT1 [Denticeps clupeoides]|uniref:active regulator of SIRT1 n=1 Tax=Denticeps clupeoides TaxID=299321 RepID=UPI0010A34AB2|nr:active regulator of SIRT1 [Denticeps clupeoides]